MKLRKTKSAIAVLLAVMLLVSTMIVAPVSASAATAGESVGDEYYKRIYASDTNLVYYGFSATGLEADAVWSNTPAPVNIEKSDYDTGFDNLKITYSTANIEVPAGMSHIHVALKAGYDLGDDRYYKMDSSQSPAWAAWGEEDLPHIGFYDPDNSRANIVISVLPESKIAFRYVRFESYGNQLVYTCQMTELPPTASETTKLGDVAITVDPESAPYSDSRDVTINVTNIDSRIPLDKINVDYSFGKGTFTPANTSNDTTNHTITVTGTLTGFTEGDIGDDYVATATAETDYIHYDQGQHKVIGFEAVPATDTYDIEDIPVVQPTEENKYITVTLTVDPSTIGEDQPATLTAMVSYPPELPADQVQYVGVTVTDDAAGTNVLQPSQTSPDADHNQIEYTYILNENTYSADNSPIRFTANPTYTGSDYLDTAQNILYHFIPYDRAYADLTVTASYETVTEYVTISLSVDPTSMVYDGSAVVTAVMTAPEHFPAADITSIGANLSENTGKTLPGASVSNTQNTVTEVYTLPAGFFTANDIGTVTFTAAANINPAVADVVDTANRKIYHFEVGQPATATLELTGKNNEIPVINNVEGGGIQLEVTPEVDLYNIQRDAVVTVSNIDPHIYAEFGNYDHIALALTDDKGHTFNEDTTKRSNITATSFKTAFVVPDNTYSIADVGVVTYTVTATYDGGDIYDATNATTYSFTDGQTATDTSELTDYDENLQYTGRYLILLDAIEVVYVVPAASISDYTDPVLTVKNLYVKDSSPKEYAGVLNTTSGNYEFKFKVAPGYAVDDHALTMRAKRISDNKTVIGLQKVDSIYTYAYSALNIYKDYINQTGIPEMLSTVVDMLNYAAAVQQYGGHHKEKLANDNIAPYQQYSMTENFAPENKNAYMNVMTTGATFKIGGTSLKFSENITPIFQINPAEGQDASTLRWSEDYYVEVIVGNKTYRLTTPVETSVYQGNYLYSNFEFNELMANQLDRELYVTVRETATGAAVSDTYRYTANSYLPKYLAYCDQYNYTPDAKIVALTTAMARYGESTRQYALLQGHVL